jgi:hypothetical protein
MPTDTMSRLVEEFARENIGAMAVMMSLDSLLS